MNRNIGELLVVACVVLTVFALPTQLAWGLAGAGFVIALIGKLDERYRLSPGQQLIGQVVAAAMLIAAGWTIDFVTNPVGDGLLMLGSWGNLLAIIWLVGLMNVVNWLDGVDGLAGGVGLVAFAALGVISLLPATYDTVSLLLALIGTGTMFIFLLGNWPPAKIYLGTTGAWWLGLFLGTVAMAGQGKITTTALVLAWPLLDAATVVISRLLAQAPIWQGDQRHLHHRLQAAGFSPRRITLLAMAVSTLLAAGLISLSAFKTIDCRDFSQGKIAVGEQELRVAIAHTVAEHAQGLSGCKKLPAGTGMYFVFESKQTPVFWMREMLIPLDFIWIANNKVVGISANVPAPADPADPNSARVYPPSPIDAVLEIGAGQAAKSGIIIGSKAEIR